MTEKPQIMKCPGCQQMVEVAKYGDHMVASTPVAHSSIGVITTPAAGPMYPVQGASNPGSPKQKHFLILWAELWKKSSWGMVTFGFFMFCLGLIVEWYYFVK